MLLTNYLISQTLKESKMKLENLWTVELKEP
jgi:hypothetical protein